MMLVWSIILIGFMISLGIVVGIYVHVLQVALDTEDSTRIDPLPKK
ncbi:hypothetical protein [Robertmurraya andreesenii]|uniref:Cytochrome c oxidase subunit IV n=1 Tax=Anoxybacillus andreesenii TaxID=1325932 RepID=A0ABT9V3J8_9BACL|nr:hypothetical protein [Robertmurraya andreesenii]MDQ0155533.1 cytochrome c oxidase subunit IV [Robertmurraya andreesenii]